MQSNNYAPKNEFLCFSHFNIRSIFTNFDLFSDFVADESLDIIGLSETWLDNSISDHSIRIPEYKIVRRDRRTRGGGVAFFIKESIKYKILDTPTSQDGLENLWISVKLAGKRLCLGTLYRPPLSDLNVCLEQLENALVALLPEYDYVLFGGDFNVDMSNNNNTNTSRFVNFLHKYGLHQNISEPTRVTAHSSTLIDLLISSHSDLVTRADVIRMEDISDHSLVKCTIKIKKEKQKPKWRTYRDFSDFNYNNFTRDLLETHWDYIFSLDNVDDMIQFWNDTVLHLFNIHAPFKTIRITKKPAPWLTDNIKLMIKLKQKAYAKYKKVKTHISYSEYKELRNFVNSSVKAEKKAFLQHKFKSDPKLFWKTLSFLNITKENNELSSDLDPNLINDFFLNNLPQPQNVVNNEHILQKYDAVNFHRTDPEFNFTRVTVEQVEKLLRTIKTNAIGSDEINIKMLSLVFPHLSIFFTHIVNTCLLNGVFPKAWKDANIIPVPKSNKTNEISNYRPISILPTLSKILEKIVAEQLNEYLNKKNILPVTQSGFRERHSTTTALLEVTDELFRARDSNKETFLILLDLSKAFDTLNHSTLCKKLSYFGLSDNAVLFFKNYLSDRRQRVVINNEYSRYAPVKQGVPQGSVLGPLLFSIYTADFFSFLKYCYIHQYADDTQLLFSFSVSNYLLAVDNINEDLKIVSEVASAHSLVLNESKTELLVFGKNREIIIEDTNFKIILNDSILTPVDYCKNLGLFLDVNLKFNKHVEHLIKASYGKLKLLYMYKNDLNCDIKILLCDSLILSQLAYCDVVYWSALLHSDKASLQKIQNTCIRYIFNLRKYDHISCKFSEAKWLNLTQRYMYHMACLIFKIDTYQTPKYLFDKLVKGGDIHDRVTRNRNLYSVPRHNTAFFQKSFTYNAVKIFNEIPVNIKSTSSVSSFRKQVKTLMFNNS